MPAWLPSSLLASSLSRLLPCNGSPFLASPPPPPPIGANLTSKPAIAGSLASAAWGWDPGRESLGGRAYGHEGGFLGACVSVCLEGETCFEPARATSLEVGRAGLQEGGGGEVQTLPFLTGPGASCQPLGHWETRWAFLCKPGVWTGKSKASFVGCSNPSSPKSPPSPGLQVFCSPRPEPGVGESSPTLGTRAPRGTRDFGGTGLLPPPNPSSLPASLGTKQSLLSNFKCYLRTAWPQPKAALWKLVFRCRGCKYQRHTFGGVGWGWGGASTLLPSLWQGLALNGHIDTQRPAPAEGHTHHAVACDTRHMTGKDHSAH